MEDTNKTSPSVPISKLNKASETSILIVEDDKFLRDLIVQKLKKEGFTVHEAVNGEEAIKKLKEVKPMVILLDLVLPGMDGFEVLRNVKEDEDVNATPIIVLSNLGSKEDIDKALKEGAKDFLVKAHFTPAEIVAKVKQTLQTAYL